MLKRDACLFQPARVIFRLLTLENLYFHIVQEFTFHYCYGEAVAHLWPVRKKKLHKIQSVYD